MYKKILFILCVCPLLLCAEEGETAQATHVDRLSETLGHLIVKQLKQSGFELNFSSLIKGMDDEQMGKPAPLSDEECEQMMCALQEKQFLESVEKNLAAANEFLKQNREKNGIREIEPQLQFQVVKEGNGDSVIDEGIPLIHYKGTLLDGTVFATSESMVQPVALPIKQSIPGFAKGIVGMKEGEKRILYIHPDLAYGLSGHLPPNSLLIFEVEVVKANSSLANVAQASTEEENQTVK